MGLFDKLFGKTKKDSGVGQFKNTIFTSTDKLMGEDKFWEIIQTTKDNSDDDFDEQQKELAKELGRLTADDIILFGNRFRYFRGLANTWELWGAIYIIHGGCSDDSFNDFREWVIGQGKDFYYKTIKDPESLVEIESDKIEDVEWEGLGYIPAKVFKQKTGQDMQSAFEEQHITTGMQWEEEGEDLKNMFPKLYAKYPDHI